MDTHRISSVLSTGIAAIDAALTCMEAAVPEMTVRWDPFGDEPLLGSQLAARRADPEFTDRLARRVDEDQALLRRIAEEEPMSRTVRAKMFVQEIAQTTWGGRVKLQVVSRGEDNKEWASATPSGQLDLTIRNDKAMEVFTKPGLEVFVDITVIDEERQGKEGMGE